MWPDTLLLFLLLEEELLTIHYGWCFGFSVHAWSQLGPAMQCKVTAR